MNRLKRSLTLCVLSLALYSYALHSIAPIESCDCHHCHEDCTCEDCHKEEGGLPEHISLLSTHIYSANSDNGITITANIKPDNTTDKRCVWTSSDTSKVLLTPTTEYSTSCLVSAVSAFTGEVTINVKLLSFPDVSYSCKATYEQKIVVTPLLTSLSLSSSRTYNCPASYSTSYGSKSLSQLFSLTGSDKGLTYTINNSNAIISGSDVKCNSLTNGATATITATSVEDSTISASIPITISYSKTGNSSSHNYVYSTCFTKYESGGSSTSYGSWSTTKAATCTASGTQSRTVTTTTTRLRYDNDKYVCSYCGDYYWSGYYHYSAGDTSSTSTSTETSTIAALGHDWSSYSTTTEATCTNEGVSTSTCSRCGEKRTVTIPALGHNWTKTSGFITSGSHSGTYQYTCFRCGSTKYDY